MNICDFSMKYLTQLLAKILQEEKAWLVMPGLNISLLNTDIDHNVSDFYVVLSSNFLDPYILQPTRLAKNSKTLLDNIFKIQLNSIIPFLEI